MAMKKAAAIIVPWVRGLPMVVRAGTSALTSAILFYGGAIVENQVQVLSQGGLWPASWGHATAIGVGFLIAAGLALSWRETVAAFDADDEHRRETLAYAWSVVDQHTTWFAKRVSSAGQKAINDGSQEAYLSAITGGVDAVQDLVNLAYQLFESRYGQSHRIEDRIDFEVTFMTKSYVDQFITIPASANRAGRQPRSMVDRPKNPMIYENTVTGSIYRNSQQNHPETVIVADTEAARSNYAEIYVGQKQRIKSSIIHPVFSPANELLGTLVVHCNRAGFFREEQRKYWVELLDVFARSLALEKSILDSLHLKDGAKLLSLQAKQPF